MNWYKTAQTKIPGYPYYLAVHREGRLKGQYPTEIAYVPSLKKQWDKGGFGTGKKTKEFKSEDVKDLLEQLKMRRINPSFDDVDFYTVRSPNSPREKIQYPRLLDIMRREPKEPKEPREQI